ncbi:MFS transporter [Glutamicibacter soli]|uniref:MFS transporter n=2 Tax=Glutamicibacter soli TaxID=453836 RepID=A0A6L9G7L6_9MICC|nr:MFS transporter [Glutamicibacter soli]
MALALAAVVLLGLNLRVAVASAAALFPALQELLGYGPVVAALLPTIPVLCFAFAGLATTRLMRWLGLERSMMLALVMLTAGLSIRLAPTTSMLLLGTIVAMSGLAVCNVAMPSFVRKYFPQRTAGITSLYSITMSAGAALASGISVPIALQLDSPLAALGVWAIPTLATLVVVAPLAIGARREKPAVGAAGQVSPWPLLATRRGLLITGLFTLQALLVYSIVGWLPSILVDRGMDSTAAGMLLGGLQLVTIPATVLVMALAARGLLRAAFMIASCTALAGFVSLELLPVQLALLPTVFLGIGFTMFPLVMLSISRSGESVEESSAMSSLAQSVGYIVAAIGPFSLGLLSSQLGSWSVPLWLLVAAAVLQVLLALWLSAGTRTRRAGRLQQVDAGAGK